MAGMRRPDDDLGVRSGAQGGGRRRAGDGEEGDQEKGPEKRGDELSAVHGTPSSSLVLGENTRLRPFAFRPARRRGLPASADLALELLVLLARSEEHTSEIQSHL